MRQMPTGKILVVDDEETMRRSLADILRLEGYQVQAVESGEAALMSIQQEPVALVLLDLKMPGMDGLEVMRLLSQVAPDTAVILLTAHGSLESAIDALRHEAFDYLLKPSSPAQILNTVQRAFSRRAEVEAKRTLIHQLDQSLQKLKDAERGEPLAQVDSSSVYLGYGILADLVKRQVWSERGGVDVVALTPTEGKLLRVFITKPGQVLTHKELVQRVQGYDVTEWEAPEVIRPLVSRLRQKLQRFVDGDKLIFNVRGTGYVFERRNQDALP